LRRTRINADIENEILTALITNSQFISKVCKMYKEDYFSDYGRILCKWVFDYWNTYQEAPGKNIDTIYSFEKESLKPAIAESIEAYLETLSNAYTGDDLNVNYMVEKARVYFRRKAYERLFDTGKNLMSLGRVENAVKVLGEFIDVAGTTNNWCNPFDSSYVTDYLFDLEEATNVLFRLKGALGDLVGPLERGWLVAILGPMKRGKSYWLQEILFQAAVHKKRVAYINLEMLPHGVSGRLFSRLLGVGLSTPERVRYPIFDCRHNQRDTCPVSKFRQNDIALVSGEDYRLPKWDTPGLGDYRACSVCRESDELKRYYVPEVWYTWFTPKREFSRHSLTRNVRQFTRHYGDRIRQLTYPPLSATFERIKQDLDELEWSEGFIPDIVVVDYADVVAPPNEHMNEYEHANMLWLKMKAAAIEKKQLWVTGSQTNRQGLEKELVSQKDTSGNIRKLAHVDVMLAINQTEEEKEDLIMRITCLVHRHRESSQLRQVLILSQLALGMPYIDSELCTY